MGDLRGGGVVAGAEDHGPIPEPLRRLHEHPPELTAADHPERGGGSRVDVGAGVRGRGHRGDSPTASVWSRRDLASAERISGNFRARIAAARRPALAAPAGPIARVPTGTPFGIWTIDRSESTPRKTLLSTGTPSTGKSVSAATIPGRWAAPPAPAI